MELPENSNGTTRSWDHPWTTNEMREKKNEWSLAADAGLLEHLKQFSDNLTENVQRTKEKLNSLTSDLNETSVIIDNITNASLALANTQFIESRVYEDDVETKQSQREEEQKRNDEEVNKEDMFSCVSENIRQGLSIMDEKFQRVEVSASDSEEEGDIPIPSFVLNPKDPYENRPLPYVIGSEKWEASSKVGLESSSSDSEPPEDEEESAFEDDNKMSQSDLMVNDRRESLMRRSSLTSSESSDRNERVSTVKHYSGISSRTDKLEARSQDTLNSGSEIATPVIAESRAESSGKGVPSFAEELAKRLGNVLPSASPHLDSQEADRASINRAKDDLFASDSGDVFGAKSENPFSDGGNLFDAEVSSSLWKDRPIRAPNTNIIPPCLDVPPPMHTEASKPRSAFDDLYGDADSEDSDDIFARKTPTTNSAPQTSFTSGNQREIEDSRGNKFLKIVQGDKATNMATSTPETNDNGGMFGDESEADDDVLFGKSVKSQKKTTEKSPEVSRDAGRAKSPGLSITQPDTSSNVGSRLFQRVQRQDSDDSSDSESWIADPRLNKSIIPDDSNQNSAVSIQNKSEPSSIVAGNAIHVSAANTEKSDSSGISIRPNSTSNTFGLGVDFQPQVESTRLRSEDIYRERVPSDSLFTARTRPLDDTNSINNSSSQPRAARDIGTLDRHSEEEFDSDDVFGPPPLPKADSKSKSEMASVDDLFSNVSSGSRSQKSSDLLAATEPQFAGKSASARSRGLFDEDIDIFGSGDAPDLDIFSEGFKSSLPTKDAKSSSSLKPPAGDAGESFSRKLPVLFPTETDETSEIFSSRSTSKKSAGKPNSIFDDSEDDDDDDDLFGSSFLKSNRKPPAMPKSEGDNFFAYTEKSSSETALTALKKDSVGEAARADRANESVTKPDVKRDSDVVNTIESALPSYPSGGLFDNLDDDDDDDCLFDNKKAEAPKEKSTSPKIDTKSTVESHQTGESKMEDSKFKSNYANIETLLKDSSLLDTRHKKISEKEDEPNDSEVDKSLRKKSPKPSPKKKPTDLSPKKLLKDEKENTEEISTTDGAKSSKPRSSPEVISEPAKREPPRTLSIRLPMPSAAEDSAQPPRRAVSGKIKNLMGKMGDLKILSPTDTPPLWKKAEEKPETDEEITESKDSEDGSFFSIPSTKTPAVISKTEESVTVSDESKEPPPSSPPDDSGNSESAVSFDVPAQVETLAVTASKSRARIQAKRRPQSRHARQSALRTSGIDFDTVDITSAEAGESDPSDSTMSGISDKVPTVVTDSVDSPKAGTDRLLAPHPDNARASVDKPAEPSSSLAPDDRSELSLSKGSSMSINKNTLLSPSTDEEDLFDVPPDLPEDPPKEDTLFGRAPILSPIDAFLDSKHTRTTEKFKETRSELRATESTTSVDKNEKTIKSKESSIKITEETKSDEEIKTTDTEKRKSSKKAKDPEVESLAKKPMDPLRDNSHDPLKDPSQLFAFVTKTPSPEKGQNLLFKEDDSLFTRVAKKSTEEAKTTASKKTVLDLFADDSTGDLFSAPLAKKSAKGLKSSGLFDDTDTDEEAASDLFGSGTRPKGDRKKVASIDDAVASKSSETSCRASPSRGSSVFAEDADDDLFVDALDKKFSPEPEKFSSAISDDGLFSATSKAAKDSKLKDLFGDQSSGEDDIFASKKTIGSGKTSAGTGSLFSVDAEDEDVSDIFGKRSTEKTPKVESIESRASAKKPVTRDLKKTAEKIVEDPLSMLQDD